MVLPRVEQAIQEKRTELGVKFQDTIRTLLDLAKGRTLASHGSWFYSMFLSHSYAPDDIEQVRQKLEDAWWIEESDIKQEILGCVWRLKLTSQSDLRYTIGRYLKDWLLKQRVFSRQSEWEHLYLSQQEEYTELQRKVGLPMVFQANPIDTCPFSLFNRYLMYLSFILKLPRSEIEQILLSQSRQVNRFQNVLRGQMEEYYGTPKHTG